MTTGAAQPVLDRPGAGIPWIERTIGKFIIFNFRLKKPVDVEGLRGEYQGSLAGLMAEAKSFSDTQRETQVLIPRLRGLEDSSRYYSPAMVLEHIARVDGGVAEIINLLGRGEVPPRAPGTADVKPTPGISWAQAIQMVSVSSEKYLKCLSADFASPAALPHPWFGPLTAWQWAQFIVVHHGIHLQQLKKMKQVANG